MPIQVGDRAPDFTAQTDEGTELSLADTRGQTVVVYFYPRADTGG